jgi:methylenetetrahydrofolate reductase (NADPH)
MSAGSALSLQLEDQKTTVEDLSRHSVPSLSFEFFPPKTADGLTRLLEVARHLAVYKPEYVSVTFGAGGTTQSGTLDTVKSLLDLGFVVMPHLSCVGMEKGDVEALLTKYQQMGVSKILALRGDLPSGAGAWGDFRYASDLVNFIRQRFGSVFEISVAVYPEVHPASASYGTDIESSVLKIQQGSSSAITQYFFSAQAYAFFVEDLQSRGVDVPIIPGIMPITNYRQLVMFSERCGAEVPVWVKRRLAHYENDPASLRAFGTEVMVRLVQELLGMGVPGFHFYTLNQSLPSQAILDEVFSQESKKGWGV